MKLDTFRERFAGSVIGPEDPEYDRARAVWNGMIDRRPALIARCTGVADVIAALELAREHDLVVAVRGGGHNVAGTATCDGGIVIDLSPMRAVRVDPAARRVWAQGGCTWGDVDRETQLFGLAVPGGVVSETGIAGLTLSGGYSSQRRAHGMTIDNLVSCDVVTADGRYVRASETENPDLFWALRGGGGNFGVVTAFEYGAHELGPTVYAAQVLYPIENARELLRAWRDLVAGAPDEITSDALLWSFPPAPDVPPELHGAPVLIVGGLYAGPAEDGERALRPLRELGTPIVDNSGPLRYTVLQSSLDALGPAGRRYYWKSLYLDGLGDDAIDFIVEHAGKAPSRQGPVVIRPLGGAIGRVPAGATAFGDRSASFNLSIDAAWDSPAEDERNIAWVRRFWSDAQRYSNGRTYFNFAAQLEGGNELVRTSFGAGYERLVEVKTAYDPTNLFTLNPNIEPRERAASAL